MYDNIFFIVISVLFRLKLRTKCFNALYNDVTSVDSRILSTWSEIAA